MGVERWGWTGGPESGKSWLKHIVRAKTHTNPQAGVGETVVQPIGRLMWAMAG